MRRPDPEVMKTALKGFMGQISWHWRFPSVTLEGLSSLSPPTERMTERPWKNCLYWLLWLSFWHTSKHWLFMCNEINSNVQSEGIAKRPPSLSTTAVGTRHMLSHSKKELAVRLGHADSIWGGHGLPQPPSYSPAHIAQVKIGAML